MDRKFEEYPPNGEGLYFVEFSQWDGEPERYRLFKRNFMYSKEKFEEMCKNEPTFRIMGREVHPWQLHNGEVNTREGAIDFETKTFLKFVVDSLNKNSKIE